MRVLLVGGGGREHALAWRLRASPGVEELVALPGSDAIATLGRCVPGDPNDPAAVRAAARAAAVDLVVIGPEAPLAAGVADALRAAGFAVFGPSRAAACLESSKAFAKEFMARHAIPTARFELADDVASGRRALARLGLPVAIKADGLAAGKGVVLAATMAEAEAALAALLSGELAGAAGRRLVIEECLRGPEISLLALCDGERYALLPPARDYKRLGEGDAGPNTGGMGAISSDGLLPAGLRAQIEREVVQPTLAGMARAGTPFQGVLFGGLMLTAAGPRVLEFNARFGDPETQALVRRLGGDLAGALAACAAGRLDPAALAAPQAAAAACVVAAAAGYPAAPRRGDAVSGLEAAAEVPGVVVFHAGLRREDQAWRTAGGRVLAASAAAATLPAALAACYRALQRIRFSGMQYRRDIGRADLASHPNPGDTPL